MMKATQNKFVIYSLLLCIFFSACNKRIRRTDRPANPSQNVQKYSIANKKIKLKREQNEEAIPKKVVLDVPFSSQAPFANWDDPYQEACEEMSLIMVHAYMQNKELSKQDADGSLLALIAWETRFGFSHDITLQQLATVANGYYGHHAIVSYDVTIENIKKELVAGNPVIVPAAGRKLGNPYFSGEGPWYHMLVIIGYDDTHFITNDPGTRRGKRYKYKHDVLLNAIHNWTGKKEETESGGRVMMTIDYKI